ncbi:DUF4365 domain-containing protein [Flavobacteriaceae bacterium M23B6Z8]
MTKRNKSQFIGTKGESFVQHLIDSSEIWISRKMPNDFGIDFEIEFCDPIASGEFIKLQVKSSENFKYKSNIVKGRVPYKLLKYAYECKLPVVLVLVDTKTMKSYFCWLQEWIETYFPNREILNQKFKSTVIEIPTNQTLQEGLQNSLIEIAKGKSKTSFLFTLREVIKTSMLFTESPVTNTLTKILIDVSQENKLFTLETIIEEIISLGNNAWRSDKGNKASSILHGIIRDFGHQVKLEHIDKILLRGDGLSRVGIGALGHLYSSHFEHIKKMSLPAHYKKKDIWRLVYYCKLREKYPDKSDMGFCDESLNTEIDGYDIDKGSLFDKLISRGTSAIFDYMYSVEK